MERIAHRGAKLEYPENTIPAFQRAVERGADAVELDVHATSDGVVVVHHDAELGRYANALSRVPIADLTWEQVRAVRIAGAIGIPTLSDVLNVLPSGITCYVELKGSKIEAVVAQAIGQSTARCAVHSFDHPAIARYARLAPATPRGILLDQGGVDVLAAMRKTGARDVWPSQTLIDRRLVDAIHGAGGRVIAWTVNSRARAAELAALGVDGICTDDVRLLDGDA